MTDTNLTARFHQEMLDGYQQLNALGYKATSFLQMVNEHGGVETARRLLRQPNPAEGLTRLWEMGRLDLSVEAFVLRPEYATLFTPEELAVARRHLADLNYTAPWDQPPAPAAPAPSLVERLARAVSNTQGGDESGDEQAPEPPGEGERIDKLSTWQAGIETLSPLNRQFVQQFPAWLAERFGNRAVIIPSTGQRFSVYLDGARVLWGRVNKRFGVLITLGDVREGPLLEQLRAAGPELRPFANRYGAVVSVSNDAEYTALQRVVELLAQRSTGPAPQPAAQGAGGQLAYTRAALDRAIAQFQQHFPSLADQRYHDDERFYKEHFGRRMRELIGREQLGALIARGDFEAAKAAIKQACGGSVVTPGGFRQQNNLLNQWDRIALFDTPAEPLARRLYDLLYGDAPFAARFDAWVALLGAKKPGVWPSATYFLALHDPTAFIFVKPSVFQAALSALGIDAPWQTRPDSAAYERLRDLARRLLADLAPLGARDMIDVQSFLWRLTYQPAGAWLFVADPATYDLSGALAELEEIPWISARPPAEVQVGQTVYLWESGARPGLAAVARVRETPRAYETAALDTRFARDAAQLPTHITGTLLEVEQVLLERISPAALAARPALADLAVLKGDPAPIQPLTPDQIAALAALVAPDDDPDDEAAPALGESAYASLAEWQRSIATSNPLVRRLVADYPAWVAARFGERVLFRGLENQRFSLHVGGRRIIRGRMNQSDGAYIWLQEPPADLVEALRDLVSRPAEFRPRERKGTQGWRLIVETDADYEALQLATEELVAHIEGGRDQLPPPDPLDGPAFVVTHAQDAGPQRLGAAYAFTRKAGGAPVQLLNAVRAWQEGGPPVYLIIYRPGPHYTFSGWAQVTALREGRYQETEEVQYILEYTWHPFPRPASARAFQGEIPWLSRGLAVAFKGRSIQAVSAADVRTIVARAYPGEIKPMLTIADAAFTVLSRVGGGPLHLSNILAQIQADSLAELRGQTPQLSLASIMLRDERFHNLGKNTWVLAPTPDDEAEAPGEAAPDEAPEPPTRPPAIYAEEDTRFWRIHFPRELWEAARRSGTIAIGWPIDSPNQSVKRFRQLAVGDRVIAYVQGGVVGGVGVVVRAFDPDSPHAGLPADTLGDDFTQYVRVAWADAPAAPVDLLDALRHARYTALYNRIKNPHTVIPLSRDDYSALLSLLLVDDVGLPRSESRLPNVWTQLAAYLSLARTMGARSLDAAMLQEAARAIDPPPAEPLDADDLVAELLQLRLIAPADSTRYQARPFVAGAETALLRLCALALLVPLEGVADQYMLPARAILTRLRAGDEDEQPVERFAPELGEADSVTLAGWYAEAGLVEVERDTWRPLPGALDPLPNTDPATAAYNLFLTTLLADNEGALVTDLAHVAAEAPLPPVEDLEERLRELGQELLFDSAIVRRVYRSLLAGRHVVLSGPPGTGKTELARLLPTLLWREAPQTFSRLTLSPDQPPVAQITERRHGYAPVIVTATEDWGVRDVVGGIGPRLDGQSGALSYTIEHGALTRTVLQHYEGTEGGRRLPPTASGFVRRDHRAAGGERYRGAWLVIDEFTRAPIDAAFGGLLTTLSGGRRATLAVPTREGELREVPLPPDFRIIGTLNSFDRHFLNQISEAMKRRFDFIDVLPPPPAYAPFEQGIAAKEALRRLAESQFGQITIAGDPPAYRWPGVLHAEPTADDAGLRRYRYTAEAPEVAQALDSFWRLFSAIRVFRQLGTAQIVAVYLNLLTGARVGMGWGEALDTALADALADQLQVLSRDEQQLIEAFVEHAGALEAFTRAARANLARVPAGRRQALRAALREADQLRSVDRQSDITLDEAALTDTQIARVFALGTPLALPAVSVFRRRLRDLAGERGL